MNETLKGVAHIGAELAAAKADLQREIERHRKTWRQLEQAQRERIDPFSVAESIRKALDRNSCPNVFLVIAYEAAIEALSQQAEAAKPVYPPEDTWPEWANWCGLDPSGYWVFYEREPVTSDVGRTPSGGSWGKPVLDEPQPCWQVMLYPRNAGKQAEPAPAQDELIPRNQAIAEAFREGVEWQRTRPAQTEQQPVAMVDANDDGMWADILPDVTVKVGQMLYAAPIAQTAPAQVTAAMWKAAHDSMESDGDLALALQEALNAAHEPTEAMLDAYWEHTGESVEMRGRVHDRARKLYAAMVVALSAQRGEA